MIVKSHIRKIFLIIKFKLKLLKHFFRLYKNFYDIYLKMVQTKLSWFLNILLNSSLIFGYRDFFEGNIFKTLIIKLHPNLMCESF